MHESAVLVSCSTARSWPPQPVAATTSSAPAASARAGDVLAEQQDAAIGASEEGPNEGVDEPVGQSGWVLPGEHLPSAGYDHAASRDLSHELPLGGGQG